MHLHEGHRQRLRRRLRAEGCDSFEDHQLLEALLFYAVPRCDTNETAHRLIERFGSLGAVFTAPAEELMLVEGVGQNSADLIRLVSGIRCRLERPDNSPRMVYDSIGKISAYLARLYIGSTREQIYLMMFDNAMRLIDCAYICDGSVNAAVMVPRVMVEKALFRHASAVVVAHNHPDGVAVPSGDDIDTTEMLRAAFELVGIQLLEHIIIAGRSYATVMRQRNMATVHAEVGSTGGRLSAGILEHFYDDLPENVDVVSVPDGIVTDLPARRQDGLGKL